MNNPGHAVEEWRPVPTLQHIEASSLGRIRYVGPKRQKIDAGHVFPQRSDREGYKLTNVPVFEEGGRVAYKTFKVHRLVALAFHGPEPLSDERIVVGHLDDDPGNNSPKNLRWMTNRENCNAPGCKAKQREARRGENHPFYGRQHSPEARAKMREANRGENNPFHGRQHSRDTRAKIGEKMREAAARRRLRAATTTTAVEPIFSRETVAAISGPADTTTLEIGFHRLPGNAAHA
jgi:hypothetical protein